MRHDLSARGALEDERGARVEVPFDGPHFTGLGADDLLLIDEKLPGNALRGWAEAGAKNNCYLFTRGPGTGGEIRSESAKP